jgi:hypothetical protein
MPLETFCFCYAISLSKESREIYLRIFYHFSIVVDAFVRLVIGEANGLIHELFVVYQSTWLNAHVC